MKKALILITATSIALACWSLIYEPALLKVRHEKSFWRNESVRVAFFSDLHAGSPHINLNYIEALVQTINQEHPDLVLIGGDLVINHVIGGTPISFFEVTKKLSALKSKLGTFVVLGNHDWWNDSTAIKVALTSVGIRVLENESITLGEKQASFNLVGLGDDMTSHADSQSAFSNLNNKLPKILLMHDPGALLDVAPDQTFDVALSGHMHCGQINLPAIGPLITPGRAPKKWANGWTDLPQGRLFVTCGIGTSILPIRLNAPPEIVILDLEKQTN